MTFARKALAAAALSFALVSAATAPVAADGKKTPKPQMTVTQITQDSAGIDTGTAVLLGLSALILYAILGTVTTGGNTFNGA